MTTRDSRPLPGLIFAAGILAFAVACALWGDIHVHVRGFQIVYLFGFLGLAVCAWLIRRDGKEFPGSWAAWLTLCGLVRLVLLPTAPSGSSLSLACGDYWRHGHVYVGEL